MMVSMVFFSQLTQMEEKQVGYELRYRVVFSVVCMHSSKAVEMHIQVVP